MGSRQQHTIMFVVSFRKNNLPEKLPQSKTEQTEILKWTNSQNIHSIEMKI